MKCGVDKLSNTNMSKLLFVKIEQGGTHLAKCVCNIVVRCGQQCLLSVTGCCLEQFILPDAVIFVTFNDKQYSRGSTVRYNRGSAVCPLL